MKIDGACHCGSIRYEAEIDPAKVVICHCTDCQALSGSAFRTVAQTKPGVFRLLSGAPRSTSRSVRAGTSVSRPLSGLRIPDLFGSCRNGAQGGRLRGHDRQRAQLIPSDQYWFRSSQAWLPDLPAMQRREKQPVFDAKGAFGD